jgi:hypothetical protein
MIKTQDIIKRIDLDFGQNSNEAFKIINEALLKYDFLNHDRIIRCIIYLAENKLDGLKQSINYAVQDPRDVVFWSEYVNREQNQIPKRVRDFNRSFENCDLDIK